MNLSSERGDTALTVIVVVLAVILLLVVVGVI
jgi:hypothetical protein